MMALVRALEASSALTYDVFLSFRGADIRNTFLGHLYTALSGAGFRIFKDDDGIERGENIKSELERAILKEARSSIIVLSEDYASSKWCLDELVLILQRNATSGHKILPVFYHVDPSQVRNQTGSFAEAFRRHEERIEKEMDERKKKHLMNKLREWRVAIKQVGSLAGMVLADHGMDESKFTQDIVKEIAKNVNKRVLYVAPYIVGMESRVKNIISWLEDDSDDAGILVIYGIGGIGKTTIAKYVYNIYSERFEACGFLENVRERSTNWKGLIKLQRQLLSEILGRKKERISSVDEGIVRIGDAIGCKKVLLVIDDVDKRDQLRAIIGLRHRFHPGNKIILTTRNQDLLKAYNGYKLHEVERFGDDESLKLFSLHAFGQDHPVEGFINHSERAIEYCGGNPLALEALASSLGESSEEEWEDTLEKLETIQHSEILEKLKISYDNLPDDNVKDLFLHIACFFIGNGKTFTVKILNACGINTISGMKILNRRSLLNFDEDNKLKMHQLLRDMGREIVRRESPNKLGERSRLWCYEDSFKVLKDKIGTEKIKGLLIDMHVMEEDKCYEQSFRARNAKRKCFEELDDNSSLVDQGNSWKRLCLGLLSWFPINMTVRNSDQEELKADAFVRMCNLTLLQLNYVEIKGMYKNFPKGLRWLCWHRFSLESLPSDISLESLVALDLRYSNLKQLWKGTKILNSLKILNLSYCHNLANFPDFSQFPNLEELMLKYCVKLVRLHESVEKLGSLLLLNLEGCKNLRQLPLKIVKMKSLIVLILSGCSGLESFPSDLGKIKSLRVFRADGINQSSCSSPKSFRFSLASLPCCLVTLNLANCNLSTDHIPRNLVDMCTLQKLNLSENPICSLPKLPMNLKHLFLTYCSSLEMLTNVPNYPSNLFLSIRGCEKLAEILGLFKLAPVDLEMVKELGLAELDSDVMLQVPLLNLLTGNTNYHKAPVLQGLYECGIYNIFLSGSVIPNWIAERSGGRSHVSFTIPSSPPNLKIQGLNVCVVFESYNNPFGIQYTDYIVVNNETRNLTVIYNPIFKIRGVGDEDVTWLSNWKTADQLMGAGDNVKIWITNGIGRKIKEFGIRIVCDDNPTTGYQNVHLDLSDYKRNENVYLLHNWFIGEELPLIIEAAKGEGYIIGDCSSILKDRSLGITALLGHVARWRLIENEEVLWCARRMLLREKTVSSLREMVILCMRLGQIRSTLFAGEPGNELHVLLNAFWDEFARIHDRQTRRVGAGKRTNEEYVFWDELARTYGNDYELLNAFCDELVRKYVKQGNEHGRSHAKANVYNFHTDTNEDLIHRYQSANVEYEFWDELARMYGNEYELLDPLCDMLMRKYVKHDNKHEQSHVKASIYK